MLKVATKKNDNGTYSAPKFRENILLSLLVLLKQWNLYSPSSSQSKCFIEIILNNFLRRHTQPEWDNPLVGGARAKNPNTTQFKP